MIKASKVIGNMKNRGIIIKGNMKRIEVLNKKTYSLLKSIFIMGRRSGRYSNVYILDRSSSSYSVKLEDKNDN